MKKTELGEQPTLGEVQAYIDEMERERGFNTQSNLQTCLQLGEEMGELFKAIRQAEKLHVGSWSSVGGLDEELADVLMYIAALANRYHIDLAKALRDKEEINKKREWK